MFTDMGVNRELNEKFKTWSVRHSARLPVDFSALILATGSWPLAPIQTDIVLPSELEACVTTFHSFYKEFFSGRKLQWLHHMCRAEIAFVAGTQRYILTHATTFHVAILLQFNGSDAEGRRTLAQLQQATAITPNVIAATVNSLLRAKVLLQVEEGVFVPNADFKRCVVVVVCRCCCYCL